MSSQLSRLGDVRAMTRVVRALPPATPNAVAHKRQLVAEFCKVLGAQFSAPKPDPTAGLSPRHIQTLHRLLEGDSEKQIALRLKVSPNTVHVYVKAVYRHFNANSRGELLSRFVRMPETANISAASPE